MDPTETFGVVSGWLRDVGTSAVSGFVFSCHFVIHTLDLELSRHDLDSTTSALGSNDPIQVFRIVCGWLRCASALQVSLFKLLRHFVVDALDPDVYRSDLVSSTSEPGSNDPMETFRGVSGWLCGMGTSAVSRFAFSSLADFYRFDLESSTSTAPSNGSVRTICGMDWWY